MKICRFRDGGHLLFHGKMFVKGNTKIIAKFDGQMASPALSIGSLLILHREFGEPMKRNSVLSV